MAIPKILTVAQQKGGAGKTTLLAQLAVAWAAAGRSVALVDIDPQQSLTHWHQMRVKAGGPNGPAPFTCVQIAGWRTQAQVERLATTHDLVLIDSAPHAETETRIAIRSAGLVLVPVQPSPMDLWATAPTLALVLAEKRRPLIVLNRVPPRAALTDQVAGPLAGLGVGVATSRLGNRTGFAASMARGRGVLETEPSGAAADELRALVAELDRAW